MAIDKSKISPELLGKLQEMGGMQNLGNFTDDEKRQLLDSGIRHSMGDIDVDDFKQNFSDSSLDNNTIDRTQALMGQLGLSDDAIKQMYGEYKPQDVAEREEFGKAGGILDDLYGEASSGGLSRWGQASEDRQRLGEQTAQDDLNKRTAGQQAGMFSRLAQSGGLSSGSRERMANSMGRDQMFGSQGLARQGLEQRAGISETDMGRKQQMMGQLPGMFSALGGQRQSIDNYNMDRKDRFAEEERQSRLGARTKGGELFGGFKTNQEKA